MTRPDKKLTREEQRLLPPTSQYQPKDAREIMGAFQTLQDCNGRPCIPLRKSGASLGDLAFTLLVLTLASPIVFAGSLGVAVLTLRGLGIADDSAQHIGRGFANLVCGFVLLFPVYLRWKRQKAHDKFGQARLLFNQRDFRVGDEVYLEYEKQLSKPSQEMGWVLGHLACVEIVRMRQGTDFSYSEAVLWEHFFEPAPLRAGQQVQKAHWSVTLPADLPLSRIEKDRWIVWHWQFKDDFGRFSGTYNLNLKTLPALRPLN